MYAYISVYSLVLNILLDKIICDYNKYTDLDEQWCEAKEVKFSLKFSNIKILQKK